MSFTVLVSHGSEKLSIEVQRAEMTVGDLKEVLADLTEIPPDSQKLIFKGKTLQENTKLLTDVGLKQGSRLMVLGRKSRPEEDPSYRDVTQVSSVVDGVEKKLDGIKDEIIGIEQGFLQAELVAEACRGLHKRCLTCGELLMQNLEKLDGITIPATETLIRGRKKSTVFRIQALLKRNDELVKRIDASRNT